MSLKWDAVSLIQSAHILSWLLIYGCTIDVEGARIGNNNIVESRARIVGSTSVGNYCVIGSGCSTESNETIPDLTIIYGSQSKRRNQSEPLAVKYT